jgi:protocatechuate 3,4-dioxygenase, alpha subunit
MSNVTTSQTIGPFFHEALKWGNAAGDGKVELQGRIVDGAGKPIDDALIEAWADNTGGIEGFDLLRQPTDHDGRFVFRLPIPSAGQPLAHVCVFARGCLNHHFTAVFTREEEHALLIATPPTRRASLIATAIGANRYEWTIRMQGDDETVFFEYQ